MQRGFVVILLLLLAACVDKADKLHNTPEPTVIVTKYATSVSTKSSTRTATTEQGSQSNLTSYCSNGEKPSTTDNLQGMDGVILYSNKEYTQWYTLTGSPLVQKAVSFPSILYDTIVFSPNTQWAISYDDLPNQVKLDHASIQLIGPKGQSQNIEIDMSKISESFRTYQAPSFSFQHWYFEWVNNEIVLVRASYSETPDYAFPTYQYALYDVFQQTWLDELTEDIPDREPYSWINVSPNLKDVLYRTVESDMALWSLDQKKTIWIQPDAADSDQTQFISEWSPDGRFVTVKNFPDLMIISEEGKVIRSLEEIYALEANTYIQKNVWHEWSPGGQRLAVLISTFEDGKPWKSTLYVYPVEGGNYIYACSLGYEDQSISKIIWSPDGNFVMAKNGQTEASSIFIFDLQSLTVYQHEIPEIAYLLWLHDK